MTNYGRLDTKIVSLAQLSQLSQLHGARADIALLSLGRTYVLRCKSEGGNWTSGLHVFWWARSRLAEEPVVQISDIRVETALPMERQIELAKWSILMLRLTFLSDVGHHALDAPDPVRDLANLVEEAAEAVPELSYRRLITWTSKAASRAVGRVREGAAGPAASLHEGRGAKRNGVRVPVP